MESLSSYLLLEIFLRLPCKNVVVCKCVCKEWYNLLSDPMFNRDYTKKPPFTSIFLLQHYDYHRTSSVLLLELGANGQVITTKLDPKIPNFHYVSPLLRDTTERHTSSIIGTYNGLFFFSEIRWTPGMPSRVVEKLYSYNPVCGDCRRISLEEQERSGGSFRLGFVMYRIGYISSTNNIKLLRIIKNPKESGILTVGIDDRWRRLDDRLDYHDNFQGVSFNGVYHWIHEDRCLYLKTFDFGKEEIGPKWKIPNQMVSDKSHTHLVVVDNRLSMIKRLGGYEMVVWTMEEYGVTESWSKKMVIRRQWFMILGATLTTRDFLFSNYSDDEITVFNPEKEDIKIKIPDTTGLPKRTLYVGEFAPRFY